MMLKRYTVNRCFGITATFRVWRKKEEEEKGNSAETSVNFISLKRHFQTLTVTFW